MSAVVLNSNAIERQPQILRLHPPAESTQDDRSKNAGLSEMTLG